VILEELKPVGALQEGALRVVKFIVALKALELAMHTVLTLQLYTEFGKREEIVVLLLFAFCCDQILEDASLYSTI
jgi:hypothetical protein